MPELPEVEAARKAIEDNCLGKRIKKSIVADDSKVIDGVSASDFEASLSGKTIVAAHRKGKNLWLELDSPPFPSFQFGMAGAVYIKGVAVTKYKRSAVKDGEQWPSKYSKVFIELDDGMEFSFTDKRRFAKVRLLKDPASVPPISELGPDALLEPMTEDEFVASLSKKKIAIKPLLLDQSYISGIGNWIADEVLYQAKIHPLQVASSLSEESCATLQKCIKEVIEKAVEVGADSSLYPNNWIFHTREKKPGKAFVDGKKIEFITAGGRTTAFVPELQKLTGNQAAKGVSKQRKQRNQRKGRQDESDGDDDDVQETDEGDVAAKTKGKKETKPRGQTKKKVPAKRKSEESNDGTDEEDNVAENTKLKKWTKAKGQVKKVPAKRKSEESDEGTAEEDKVAEKTKPKKGTKAKGQVKKVLAKIKSKESDDDEDDDGTDEDDRAENTNPKKGTKAKGQAKKNLPAKRKSKESDEEENEDDEEENEDDGSGEDDKVQKKKSKKITNDKQSKARKTTKKKAQPRQTSKNVKKK